MWKCSDDSTQFYIAKTHFFWKTHKLIFSFIGLPHGTQQCRNFWHKKVWCLSFQTHLRTSSYVAWIKSYSTLKFKNTTVSQLSSRVSNLIILKRLVTILPMLVANSSFRCSGSQIEISIMKSVREHQCEWLLIYDHDDLSDLHIEINFLKKIIFGCFLSFKILNKLCIKNAWKS